MRASEFFDLSRFQSSYTTARWCMYLHPPQALNRVVSSVSFIPFSYFYSPVFVRLSPFLSFAPFFFFRFFLFFLFTEHSQLECTCIFSESCVFAPMGFNVTGTTLFIRSTNPTRIAAGWTSATSMHRFATVLERHDTRVHSSAARPSF